MYSTLLIKREGTAFVETEELGGGKRPISFDDVVTIDQPFQPTLDRAQLHAKVNALYPRGGTNIHDGLKAGFTMLGEYPSNEKQNRVIFLSDGLATVGITSDEKIDAAIEQLQGWERNRCAAALLLGRSGSTRAIEPLIAAARSADVTPHTQSCVVGALAELGETAVAAGYYTLWLQGDNPDLWRSAITGFGDPRSCLRWYETLGLPAGSHRR